jgi:hypothetical protein
MTNDEIRMTNQTPIPNDEAAGRGRGRCGRRVVGWSLSFRHSFVIRPSEFVIRQRAGGVPTRKIA